MNNEDDDDGEEDTILSVGLRAWKPSAPSGQPMLGIIVTSGLDDEDFYFRYEEVAPADYLPENTSEFLKVFMEAHLPRALADMVEAEQRKKRNDDNEDYEYTEAESPEEHARRQRRFLGEFLTYLPRIMTELKASLPPAEVAAYKTLLAASIGVAAIPNEPDNRES